MQATILTRIVSNYLNSNFQTVKGKFTLFN